MIYPTNFSNTCPVLVVCFHSMKSVVIVIIISLLVAGCSFQSESVYEFEVISRSDGTVSIYPENNDARALSYIFDHTGILDPKDLERLILTSSAKIKLKYSEQK
jgi:hypothetical protein